MNYALRDNMPRLPGRMRALPIEARGYPVPWFVEWIDGKPDFRVMDRRKWVKAVRFGNCWLCGEVIGRQRTFVLGPMCTVSRTTSEPPCHIECARFAVMACPFMILPGAKYRKANLPENAMQSPGMPIDRNPGCTALWTTASFKVFKSEGGNAGQLIQVGAPTAVEWWARGAPASREDVDDSIRTGMPLLEETARAQGEDALKMLYDMALAQRQYLPQAAA